MTDDESSSDPEWRTFVLQCAWQSSRDADRTLITLASGALALSIIFVHDLAPHPHHTGFLILAWAAFGISLLLILLSLSASGAAFRDEWRRLIEGHAERKDSRTPLLNRSALFAFVSGVVSLLAFAAINL